MLAILLPLTGYFLVQHYSKEAEQMPRHYFIPDSVIVNNSNGKTSTDTIWHKVKNLHFVNQMGKSLSLDSLHGKIVVIDFFFSHCPSICPALARSMKKLQDAYEKIHNDSTVRFVSISVDPEHDSVPQLRKFADRYDVNHDTWWFVRADKEAMKDFAMNEVKAGFADTNVDTAFIHTENFFLLDTNRIVRGYYNGLDTLKQQQLARDISLLMLEKDKNDHSFFRQFIPILPVIFIAIAIVFIVMGMIGKKRKTQ